MSKKCPSQEYVKTLLEYDQQSGIFIWSVDRGRKVRKGHVAGTIDKDGYRVIMIDGKNYRANRLAIVYVRGVLSDDSVVDHWDGNKLNDSYTNLRETSIERNTQNSMKRSDNTSGVKGVSWNRANRKWAAYCNVKKKRHNLGLFSEIEEAAKVVAEFRNKHHGEFANHG